MKAELLSVGTELLIGQTVNTNATWLGGELAALGVGCYWVTTVGDNFERLGQAIATALDRADLVIVTGGLGPTDDDITIEAIARHLGEPLVERPEVRAHIEDLFRARNRPMTGSNYKQALFPPSAELIPNPAGTAYGLALRLGSTQLMAFPGVPMELKEMWASWAQPRLAAAHGGTLHSALLKYVGIGESALAERVAHWLDGANPTVAPYAGDAEVHLRVTALAHTAAAAEALMAPALAELTAIAPYYYGRDADTLPSVVGQMLLARGQTVATAESCTGGLLTSRLTDVPGASRYVAGGVVAYDTGVKRRVLGVPEQGALDQGVVSEAVARELARSARRVIGADWGVGITGYAGPAAEVPEEDVGLVWIGIAGPGDHMVTTVHRFGSRVPRATVKFRATQAALELLRLALI